MGYILSDLKAVGEIFLRTFDFAGRSRRIGGAIYIVLLMPLANSLVADADILPAIEYQTIGNANAFALFLGIPLIAWTVRRLHDFDSCGWWATPILPIVVFPKGVLPEMAETLLVLPAVMALFAITLCPPTKGANRFGANPRKELG